MLFLLKIENTADTNISATMGSTTSHCSICGDAPVRATKGATDCDWCIRAVNSINAGARTEQTYDLKDYTPLHHFSGGLSMAVSGAKPRHVMSFVGPVEARTAAGGFGILGRQQQTPDADGLGSYFHGFPAGYRGAFRHNLSVPREWNAATAHIPLAIPPGIIWFEGVAAPQAGFPGGERQMFIPVDVARALYEPSCRFLDKPSRANYDKFVLECAPASKLQQQWIEKYRQECDHIIKDAKEHNELESIREQFGRKNFFDLLASHQRASKFDARIPKNKAKGDQLLREIEEVVQSRNAPRFRHYSLLAADILAAEPHRADLKGLPQWLQRLLRRDTLAHSSKDGVRPPGGDRFVLHDFGGGVSVVVRFKHQYHEPPSTTVYVYEVVTIRGS